jgi:CDP-diacylglycerol--glycerol-3-phosphate 3-phosphatidyltransferase
MPSKRVKKIKEKIKEDIHNIPNLLTLTRVVLTVIILYLIFADFSFLPIVILFIAGMITDGLDGYIARKYKQTTEFGRKFDMIADRFLLLGTIIGIILYNTYSGYFNRFELLLIFLVLTREILCFPFAFVAFFSGRHLPKVRFVGKLTTTLQAFALPMILLKWDLAPYSVVITSIAGIIAGMTYVHDTQKLDSK